MYNIYITCKPKFTIL